MSSNENGIRQSPFTDAFPTPDVGGTGLNGTGGGMDDGGGVNGIIASPFKDAWATPGTGRTPDGIPAPPDTIQVEGGNPAGSLANLSISTTRNTIDKR